MRPSLPLLLLLVVACQERGPASDPGTPRPARPGGAAPAVAPPPVAAAAPGPVSWTAEQQSCVERWLSERKLDAFGSPAGTIYAGGTPLFDEATGQNTPRQGYLARHRPEALAACGIAP